MAVCLEYQAIYRHRGQSIRNWYCLMGACLILFLAVAVKVAIKIQITNLGYSLAQEEQRALLLDSERRDLALQLSILTRKDRLESMARERLELGSYNPAQTRFIYR